MGFFSDILARIFGSRPKPVPVPPPAPPKPGGDVRTRMLVQLNAMRFKVGVGVLREESRLSLAAQQHASALAQGKVDPHEDFPGRVWLAGFPHMECGVRSGFGNVSEGVAEGTAPLEACLAGLMDGGGHQRDLTDPLFTLVGLGWAVGRAGMMVYVVDYGVICSRSSMDPANLAIDA